MCVRAHRSCRIACSPSLPTGEHHPNMVFNSHGTDSQPSEDHEQSSPADKPSQMTKYGELTIVGYNGFLPPGDRGRRRSKFVLYKRASPTGVKRSKHYVVDTPHSSQAVLDSEQHSVSYAVSATQTAIVEYVPDEDTDMFQIGRSSQAAIDFVVLDTIPGDITGRNKVPRCTVSRFACRIVCDRSSPRVARVYAGGFDSSRNMFLGEKATQWHENGQIDGVTTNGVLIMHPRGSFCGGEAKCGLWREVSVGGSVFCVRGPRSAQRKEVSISDETNVLQDGTLINLCGATLLWRSHEGLEKSLTKHHLETLVDELNAGRPQCPVGLNTLVIPRKLTPSMSDETADERQQPYVYLNCGHVEGHQDWGQDKGCCPICRKVGPMVKLCMGIEPAFYVDAGPPTFAFNPCGHMATEKTVKYWASIGVPRGITSYEAVCPFCATPLVGCPGYVSLIFPDSVDCASCLNPPDI